MRVVLGLYISGDLENNDAELNALSAAVESYAEILDAIIVGNEVLFFKWVNLFFLNTYFLLFVL